MQIMFSASPVTSLSRNTVTSSPMSDPVLRRTMECKNKAELETEFKAFMIDVKATDRPAVICFYQPRGDRSRAFAGFRKMRRSGYHMNLDKAPGYDEARNGVANSSAEV